MTTWNTYQMWYRPALAVANSGSSQAWLSPEWKPTRFSFRARSQPEAQKKADKVWRESQFGAGSMVCVLAGHQPPTNEQQDEGKES